MKELTKTFDASIFEIDQEKGMVNLTRIAKHFGKSVKDWTRNKNTQSFLDAYANEFSDRQILLSERGIDIEQGTWAVRQVAIEFAQWISPAFKVFCIKKLDELFQTGQTSLVPIPKMSVEEMIIANATRLLEEKRRVDVIEDKVKVLEAKSITSPNDYFTIAGYAAYIGKKVDVSTAAKIGRKATGLCGTLGCVKGSVIDPRFGTVNTYPTEVLKTAFDQYYTK